MTEPREDWTTVLCQMAEQPKVKIKHIAAAYALALAQDSDSVDWEAVNAAIAKRGRFSVEDVKARAWKTIRKAHKVEERKAAKKKRGFSFVGSTICYAFMQSVGMVNDHLTYCFRYPQCG